jgi:hypothetical protein
VRQPLLGRSLIRQVSRKTRKDFPNSPDSS